ncbi:MAG: TetR/AcrR family transcriptional regulator [Myxococcota bacterium]
MTTARATYHHGDLQKALVRGALEVIDEKGVDGLSLRAVARKAGVSAAAPYHHFQNRAELLAGIAAEGFELLHRACADAKAATDPEPIAQLTAMGTAYARFALANPGHFRVMFRPEISDRTEFPALEAVSAPVFEELRQTVLDCQTAGHIPPGDHRRAVMLAWSAVHGVSALLVDGPLRAGFDKIGFDDDEYGEIVSETLSSMFLGAARHHLEEVAEDS